MLGHEPRALHIIHADGYKLRTLCPDGLVGFFQLNELVSADPSEKPPVEDNHHRLVL
jgi:hypothetical protein